MTEACYCRRDDLAPVRVSGTDARQFLHTQTTQSIADLQPDESRLAAWLTARGRVQALFDVIPDGESFWLLTAADNAGWLVERMRLFVLRSDVALEVASESRVYSVCGDVTDWLASQDIDLEPGAVTRRHDALLLRTTDSLAHVITGGDAPSKLFADLRPGQAATCQRYRSRRRPSRPAGRVTRPLCAANAESRPARRDLVLKGVLSRAGDRCQSP